MHMGSLDQGRAFFAEMNLEEARHISDPARHLYKALGMGRAGLSTLLNPRMFRAGKSAWAAGHRQGRPIGSTVQLHGIAILEEGALVEIQRAASPEEALELDLVRSCEDGACSL